MNVSTRDFKGLLDLKNDDRRQAYEAKRRRRSGATRISDKHTCDIDPGTFMAFWLAALIACAVVAALTWGVILQ